jgi:hypothetical protein
MPRFYGDDLLFFIRDGALMAAPFSASDPTRQQQPNIVLEGLIVESAIGHHAFSDEGTRAYVEGGWLVGKSLVREDGRGAIDELGLPSLPPGAREARAWSTPPEKGHLPHGSCSPRRDRDTRLDPCDGVGGELLT